MVKKKSAYFRVLHLALLPVYFPLYQAEAKWNRVTKYIYKYFLRHIQFGLKARVSESGCVSWDIDHCPRAREFIDRIREICFCCKISFLFRILFLVIRWLRKPILLKLRRKLCGALWGNFIVWGRTNCVSSLLFWNDGKTWMNWEKKYHTYKYGNYHEYWNNRANST